jgi:hypothetical protein
MLSVFFATKGIYFAQKSPDIWPRDLFLSHPSTTNPITRNNTDASQVRGRLCTMLNLLSLTGSNAVFRYFYGAGTARRETTRWQLSMVDDKFIATINYVVIASPSFCPL